MVKLFSRLITWRRRRRWAAQDAAAEAELQAFHEIEGPDADPRDP